MNLQNTLTMALLAITSLVDAQIPGYCTSDADCSSLVCTAGNKKATCQAAGMGASSGACTCPDGAPAIQPDDPTTTQVYGIPFSVIKPKPDPTTTSIYSDFSTLPYVYSDFSTLPYVEPDTSTSVYSDFSTLDYVYPDSSTSTQFNDGYTQASTTTPASDPTATDSSLNTVTTDSSQPSITPAPSQDSTTIDFSSDVAPTDTSEMTLSTDSYQNTPTSDPAPSPTATNSAQNSATPDSSQYDTATGGSSTFVPEVSLNPTPITTQPPDSTSSVAAETSSSQSPIIIPSALSSPIASVTSQISAATDAATTLTKNPSDPQAAEAVESAISSALQAAEAAKDAAQDAALAALIVGLIDLLTAAETAAVAAVADPTAEAAAAVAASVASANAASAALAPTGIETEDPTECPPVRRSIGRSRRGLRARACNPSNPPGVTTGSSPNNDPDAMDVDMDFTEDACNPKNPHDLTENCVFVSMAHLLDTPEHPYSPDDLVRDTETMQPDDGQGGLHEEQIKNLLKSAAEANKLDYKYGEWVKGEKPLEQFVEDNDADKMAILYRRPDGSGHCVVYDADLQKSQGSGFVDFQSSANPAGFEKDGDQYIEDQAVSYFLIKKKEV